MNTYIHTYIQARMDTRIRVHTQTNLCGLNCTGKTHLGVKEKVKVSPEQAQGAPGRLRPRIFLTFGTTRVIGRQPYTPAAFTPGKIPSTHFQGLSRPQGT
jgi:hypothetical protein